MGREAAIDRQTVYYGQIPLETDLLHAQQSTMVALAKLSAAVLGTNTVVNGFTCTPTTPASLNVLLTAGEIYQLENLEATAWSSLPANTGVSILKQGIQLGNVQFGITPPGTSGQSQVFLIEVQYQDLDSGSTVLPYFNAASPTVPFMGPVNSGSAQNTVRQGIVASQVKAGVAAPTGTQVAPTVDVGWTALFNVTVANGASTIVAGNIAQYPFASAPFPLATLLTLPFAIQNNSWTFATDTGAASALVISPIPAPAAYVSPPVGIMGFWVKAANAPTGASTLNVMGASGALLGAVPIHNPDGSAIVANQWAAGAILGLFSDGSGFQLVSVSRTPAVTALRGYLAGLTLSGGGSTTLTISAGQATSDDNTTLMSLASTYTKTFAAWAVGSGNGGLDTGAIAANTWYHVFLIERTDTQVVDVLISLSPTAPTLPTSYTKQRRIGSIRTDATPNIISFSQNGDEFLWPTTVNDVNVATLGTARTLFTLTVPTGIKVNALIRANENLSGGSPNVIITSPDETDQAPSATGAPGADLIPSNTSANAAGRFNVRTNTSAQIGARSSAASTTLLVSTFGWIDTRGRFN